MRIDVLAKASYDIRMDKVIRGKAIQGAFEDSSLSQEEKQALTALATRIQAGKDLPGHVIRSRHSLAWLSPAIALDKH